MQTGLAFSPDLEGGRHRLWVTVDNDFLTETQSVIWAAVRRRA